MLRRQVSTRPEKIEAFFGQFTEMDAEFMAILEVCGFNDWLIEELRRWNCREIVLIHPERPSKKKTDRRDARKLCDLLWLNRERLASNEPVRGLRRVYMVTQREREDRQLTALRKTLGQRRTRTLNKIHRIVNRHNLIWQYPTKTFQTQAGRNWLAKVPLPSIDRLEMDVWEVIDAAATKPFGYMKFTPGPGLGGHCIPIDPLYLSWKLRALNYTARFIDLASEINTGMPRYVVGKVQDALNEQAKPLKGSRILVVGAAYKPNVDDIRESPALDIIGLLRQKGADVVYHDPYIQKIQHDDWYLESVSDILESASNADCVVIVTDHSSYDYAAILQHASLIVDTRNALGEMGRRNPQVVRL